MSTYTQEKASASEANPYHIHPLADEVPRTALRGLADKLAKTAHIPMILGLDGDCDFTREITDFYPYECGREELLALIAKDPSQELLSVKGMSGFVVLCRRHAVCLPALLWQKREKGA